MSVFPAGSEKKAGKASELLNKLLFRLDIVLCSVPFSYEFFLIFNIYEERVFFSLLAIYELFERGTSKILSQICFCK